MDNEQGQSLWISMKIGQKLFSSIFKLNLDFRIDEEKEI